MFVSTLHTLKPATGVAEEGGDPVPGASEVALSSVVDGMDCVRLAKCVSAREEKKVLLKVASAFMAETALPLTRHHVKNFTTALKRVHPAVGKAVCVIQMELDQCAESGGMLVLDIVKHVGAGITSVLPLGVMKLAALIHSLLPENDRTTGIDWLVSVHAAFNVVQKIWASRSALEGFLGIRSKYVVVLLGEAQQVLSERNLKVSNDIGLLKAQRVFKSMHEILGRRCGQGGR